MKKILTIAFFLLTQFNVAMAIEEIVLEKESLSLDYLSDVYYGKVENAPPVLKLFSERGLTFENSYLSSLKASFLYEGMLTFLKTDHEGLSVNHDFSVIEPMVRARFNEEKTEALFDINLTRKLNGYSNDFTQKISALYVSHQLTPHQKLLFGQGYRIPSTYNGSLGTMSQEFVTKSMLGRTLGDARAVGIRNFATYKYLDYDIGLYDSTRFMKDFGHGVDFTGRIIFKPFTDYNEKLGSVKIGTSYNIGEYYNSYNQYDFFLGYDYYKFHFRTEYANADGYNAIVCSNDKADGFYTTLGYDITPKITVIGRYDYFDPNKDIGNNTMREYTAGITYKMFKNMKIMLNFVRRDYENKRDSNMILFATRFFI